MPVFLPGTPSEAGAFWIAPVILSFLHCTWHMSNLLSILGCSCKKKQIAGVAQTLAVYLHYGFLRFAFLDSHVHFGTYCVSLLAFCTSRFWIALRVFAFLHCTWHMSNLSSILGCSCKKKKIAGVAQTLAVYLHHATSFCTF